jgi:hypothetical protein
MGFFAEPSWAHDCGCRSAARVDLASPLRAGYGADYAEAQPGLGELGDSSVVGWPRIRISLPMPEQWLASNCLASVGLIAHSSRLAT